MGEFVLVYFFGFFAVGLIAGGSWSERDKPDAQLRVIAAVILWPVTLLGAVAMSVLRWGRWLYGPEKADA